MAKIDWDAWNKASVFFDSGVIMRGEEKTLTDEEVEDINRHLTTITSSVELIAVAFDRSRERFKNR